MPLTRSVLIYGGKGILGAAVLSKFKEKNYWVASIDLDANPQADLNIIINKEENFQKQEARILSEVQSALNNSKLDAIFCVTGGWIGGNANEDLAKTAELMWQQSVCSSLIATTIAVYCLNEGGVLQFTGAKTALKGTPSMIGFGLAKAAVHQLTQSLAHKDSGLPKKALVVAILPVILDTPAKRKWMPTADFSTWTSLEFIGELFLKWVSGSERPESGSLLQLITKNSKTEVVEVGRLLNKETVEFKSTD